MKIRKSNTGTVSSLSTEKQPRLSILSRCCRRRCSPTLDYYIVWSFGRRCQDRKTANRFLTPVLNTGTKTQQQKSDEENAIILYDNWASLCILMSIHLFLPVLLINKYLLVCTFQLSSYYQLFIVELVCCVSSFDDDAVYGDFLLSTLLPCSARCTRREPNRNTQRKSTFFAIIIIAERSIFR